MSARPEAQAPADPSAIDLAALKGRFLSTQEVNNLIAAVEALRERVAALEADLAVWRSAAVGQKVIAALAATPEKLKP